MKKELRMKLNWNSIKSCDYPYMQPEQYEAGVIGFGLDEGLDYTIKSKSRVKD